MIHLLLLLALVAGDQIALELPKLHQKQLENGVRLVAVRMAEMPLVHYAAVIDAGSSRDPEGKEGVASMVADLLGQGTTTHPGESFAAIVDDLGGSLTTASGRDAASVTATFLAKDQAIGRDLFLEALLEPALAEAEVDKTRTRALANLQADSDEVADIATDFLYWKLFEDSRYAHPPSGSAGSIAKITHDDVVAFHQRSFIAPAMLVIACGDLDPAATLDSMALRLDKLEKHAPVPLPPIPAVASDTPKLRIVLVDNPGAAQAQIRLGWRSVPPSDPGALELETLSSMIGGGFSSRLVERLRVDLGLTYDVANEVRPMRAAGVFMVTGSTATSNLAQMVNEMVGVVQGLASAPLDDEELERAKRSMLAQLVLHVETPQGLAQVIADAIYHGMPGTRAEAMAVELRALTTEQCHRVIEQHVTGAPKVLVILGEAQKLSAALNELGPTELVSIDKVLH